MASLESTTTIAVTWSKWVVESATFLFMLHHKFSMTLRRVDGTNKSIILKPLLCQFSRVLWLVLMVKFAYFWNVKHFGVIRVFLKYLTKMKSSYEIRLHQVKIRKATKAWPLGLKFYFPFFFVARKKWKFLKLYKQLFFRSVFYF